MSPTLKLDRSRPYATVHGDGADGVAFYQDDLPFDFHGKLVAAKVPLHLREKVERKLLRLAKLADTAGDELQNEGGPPDPTEDDDDDPGTDVNFEAWLKDEIKYQPQVLFSEARRRFNKTFSDFGALAEFLVFDEQICGPDEVPTKLKRD
ncbi:MAG TPA: hypothetical protein VNZ94_00580 [Xanthobacteraceae bacterium]|nr:hypothetical protein [Xanthobacteraceae bacterium]